MRPRNDNASGKAGGVGAELNTHPHYKRFPPYGKQLMEMRRAGKVPARLVQVVFDWQLARAYPRIVIADDTTPAELNFSYLAGLPVQIVYRDKDAHKVNAIAEEILKTKPSFLATFGLDLIDTGTARTLIIPFQDFQMQVAA